MAIEQIPIAELEAARKVWSQGSASVQRLVKREHPMYVQNTFGR